MEGAAAWLSYFSLKKGVSVGPGTWALGQTDLSSNLDLPFTCWAIVSKLLNLSKAPFL